MPFKFLTNDFNTPLSNDKQVSMKRKYPNADVSNMRQLTPEDVIKPSDEVSRRKCNNHGCQQGPYVMVEEVSSGKKFFEPRIRGHWEQFCNSPEYECKDIKMFTHIGYNCMGWALGIRDYINTHILVSHEKREIEKFLHDVDRIYQAKNEISKNMDHVIDKLHVSDNVEHRNNSVAFYFVGDECEHASRYLSEVNGANVESWTAKFGFDKVFTHEFDALDGSQYGYPLGYAVSILEADHEL